MKQRLLYAIEPLVSLGVRGVGLLLGFAVTFFIGRTMGPIANGEYALVTQTAMFLSVLVVGGADLAVIRQFAATATTGLPLATSAVLRILAACGAGFILVVAVLLAGGAELLATFKIPAYALGLLCIITFSRMLGRLLSAILRSQRRFLLGQMCEALIAPAIVTAALIAGFARSVSEILWWTAGAGMVTALFALGISLRGTRRGPGTLSPPLRDTWRIAMPLWGVAVMLNLADWYSLSTAATMLSVYDAGLYRVALQFGSVFGIISMGLFSVYSVRISAAHAAADIHQIGRITRAATILSSLCVLPAIVLLVIFADDMLAWIGPEFVGAAWLVRVIAMGQALYAITGPAGLALAMTGNEKMNLRITMVSTVALLVLAPLSAHLFGLMGIAVSISLLLIGRNLASLWAVRKLIGVNVMTGSVALR